VVLWSVDTRDFTRPDAEKILATTLADVRSAAIKLMHDGGGDRQQTAAALPRIVHRLRHGA
jgi:peptidoglycan/xylan/chitin deacetylase (PgdA/CDA1 family)